MSDELIKTYFIMAIISVVLSVVLYTVICLIVPRKRLLSVPGYVHVLRLLFIAYMIYLLMLTLRPTGNTVRDINPMPFSTIFASLSGTRSEKLNLLLNIAAFIPFGALYPAAFDRNGRAFSTVFAGFAATCAIELTQAVLPYYRVFDVDDIILNTLGCAVGYVLFACVSHFLSRRVKRTLESRERIG